MKLTHHFHECVQLVSLVVNAQPARQRLELELVANVAVAAAAVLGAVLQEQSAPAEVLVERAGARVDVAGAPHAARNRATTFFEQCINITVHRRQRHNAQARRTLHVSVPPACTLSSQSCT